MTDIPKYSGFLCLVFRQMHNIDKNMQVIEEKKITVKFLTSCLHFRLHRMCHIIMCHGIA